MDSPVGRSRPCARWRRIRLLLLAALPIPSCAGAPDTGPRSAREIAELFASIDVGEPRVEVERRLGRPLLEHDERHGPPLAPARIVYFVAPPVDPLLAPLSPGAIELRFVDDRVVEKRLHLHAVR